MKYSFFMMLNAVLPSVQEIGSWDDLERPYEQVVETFEKVVERSSEAGSLSNEAVVVVDNSQELLKFFQLSQAEGSSGSQQPCVARVGC